MKTISECLDFIDNIISSDKYERKDVENLENIRRYIIDKTNDNKIIMRDVLSYINQIIEKFYDGNDRENIVKVYENLRLFILIWLDALDNHI